MREVGPFCQVTSLKPKHHQPERQCTCESSATINHTSTKHLCHLQRAEWNKADFGRFRSTLPGNSSTDVRCVLSLSVILGRLWGGNTMQPVRASAAPLCQLPANFCADQILCHLRRGHGGNILISQAASKERRDPNIPKTNLETK